MVFGFWYYYITQVVSGVEVAPAGFDVEVIAAVAERVDVRYVIRVVGHIVPAAVRYAYMLTPCVVLVLRHKCSRRVSDRCSISLKVLKNLIYIFFVN